MKKLIVIAAMLAAFGLGTAAAFAATSDKPPTPPGQPDCGHGNSQAECKDDPNPDQGKDCEAHGNQGGQNEDHCKNETTPTDTTPTDTTPTDTTPTETTPTDTTPTDTTPTDTTPGNTTPTETTPQSSSTPSETTSTPAQTTPTETTSSDPAEQEQQVFAPPAQQAKPKPAKQHTQSLVAAEVAEPVSATKPSKAAQPAPFTP